MIIIDGVVGAGKTTLGKKLSERLDIPLYLELQKQSTIHLLERFYKDKKRWSFALQIHFLNERFRVIKELSKQGVPAILDRSIFGDKIFASMLNEDGFMTDEEFETYSTLLENMLEYTEKPNILIYIDCPLEIALSRIKKRGREMEQNVPANYWKRLNEKYSEWYQNYNLSEKISIDAMAYNPESEKGLEEIVNIVKTFQLSSI